MDGIIGNSIALNQRYITRRKLKKKRGKIVYDKVFKSKGATSK